MAEKRHPRGLIAACDTPWTESFELDEGVFRRHVAQLLASGAENIYVMGTAGEGYAVTDTQFRQIVDVFVDATAGADVTRMVAVISLSMGHMIERIGYAHDRGVRMFQIPLPPWGTLTDAEVRTFFSTVCGAFPDSKFLHYNLRRSGRILGADDYRRVLDEVPNLVATKINSIDMGFMRKLIVETPELQHFVLETCYANASYYGECSLLCSFGPVAPELTRKLFDAGRDGDTAAAFAIQARMQQMHEGFARNVDGAHMDGAFDKLFTSLAQPEFPIRILPPYHSLTDAEAAAMREYFRTHCSDVS